MRGPRKLRVKYRFRKGCIYLVFIFFGMTPYWHIKAMLSPWLFFAFYAVYILIVKLTAEIFGKD